MTDELRLAIGVLLFMAIGYLLCRTGVLQRWVSVIQRTSLRDFLTSRWPGGILPSLRLATTILRRRSGPALDLAPPVLG